MLIQTCKTCVRALSFTLGSWLNVPAQKRMWRPSFHAARAEAHVWIFQSLKNCWQRALLLCGCFPRSLKQAAHVWRELSDTYRYAKVILRWVTLTGVGIHFCAGNTQVDHFVLSSRVQNEAQENSLQARMTASELSNWKLKFLMAMRLRNLTITLIMFHLPAFSDSVGVLLLLLCSSVVVKAEIFQFNLLDVTSMYT